MDSNFSAGGCNFGALGGYFLLNRECVRGGGFFSGDKEGCLLHRAGFKGGSICRAKIFLLEMA